MRTIAVVTGSRSEYGYLRPLMKTIEQDSQLTLHPIITGMHFLPPFHKTQKAIKNDFPEAISIPMPLQGDNLYDMAQYLSQGIDNFAAYLHQSPPDILVVLGDRLEALAAVLPAALLNIPIAHINGGDVSGTTIDESIRHALTKFAHIHFAHTKQNAKRIEKMGEEKNRIFVTGALTIDNIRQTTFQSKKTLFKRFHLDPQKTTLLVVHHPITTLEDKGYQQLTELMEVITTLKYQTILLYPNCDAGGQKFVKLIDTLSSHPFIYSLNALPNNEYLNLLKHVDIMLGNSSSGIIEAPYFQTPVINIGSRQQGRARSVNIVDVKPEKEEILKAVHYVLTDKAFQKKLKSCENIFGDGHAAQKIVTVLKTIKLTPSLIQKQITY